MIEKKESYFQAASYTEKQVFHENIQPETLAEYLISTVNGMYLQVNAWDDTSEHMILISKKGKVTYQCKKTGKQTAKSETAHNRKKKYILQEGKVIAPLVDMGIFTAEGKVVRSMYDKFRQINRFLEVIEDAVKDYPYEHLNIIDFGCGKSYLTFILYYYFSEVRQMNVRIVGLDLKADVIKNCNAAAEKYGYENLNFEIGDINGYQAPFPVDMVVTLHACDTATDYALEKAVAWNAKVILSVPCCQHELNRQMHSEIMQPVLKYGLIKERMASLITDALRAQLLERSGYRVQVLEFIDMEHTPKNILLRAVKSEEEKWTEQKDKELEDCMEFLHVHPTLERLLENDQG